MMALPMHEYITWTNLTSLDHGGQWEPTLKGRAPRFNKDVTPPPLRSTQETGQSR